jgi:hypothetical protein
VKDIFSQYFDSRYKIKDYSRRYSTHRILGAWLAQFKEGGHALMFQYPEMLSEIVNTFLNN